MNKILQLPMNKILHYYTLTILFDIPTLPILALARLWVTLWVTLHIAMYIE